MDLLALSTYPAEPNQAYKFIGLALGFPVAVYVLREAEGTVGLCVDAEVPDGEECDVDGEDKRYACFKFSIKTGGKTLESGHFFQGDMYWGWDDLFEKPWPEVVCLKSPYFPNGVLEVELVMEPITKEEEDEKEKKKKKSKKKTKKKEEKGEEGEEEDEN